MGPKESPEVGSRRKAKLRQKNPDQKPVALGDKEKADDVDQERPQTEVFWGWTTFPRLVNWVSEM